MTKVRLIDGMNQKVAPTRKAIKNALLRTDLVQDYEETVSISRYYSGQGEDQDEYNVYDSRVTVDRQSIYEISELEEALDEFLNLLELN